MICGLDYSCTGAKLSEILMSVYLWPSKSNVIYGYWDITYRSVEGVGCASRRCNIFTRGDAVIEVSPAVFHQYSAHLGVSICQSRELEIGLKGTGPGGGGLRPT